MKLVMLTTRARAIHDPHDISKMSAHSKGCTVKHWRHSLVDIPK
jgi:hypothetical protein